MNKLSVLRLFPRIHLPFLRFVSGSDRPSVAPKMVRKVQIVLKCSESSRAHAAESPLVQTLPKSLLNHSQLANSDTSLTCFYLKRVKLKGLVFFSPVTVRIVMTTGTILN